MELRSGGMSQLEPEYVYPNPNKALPGFRGEIGLEISYTSSGNLCNNTPSLL